MEKARLDADYHEVPRRNPFKTKLKTDKADPECHFNISFLFSPVGKNLQRLRRENRANSGRHSHLPAAGVEHFKWGASLPSVLQWSCRVRPQNGGWIHVSAKILSSRTTEKRSKHSNNWRLFLLDRKLYQPNNAALGMAAMRAGVNHWQAGLIEVAHGMICKAYAILMVTHGPLHPITKDLDVSTSLSQNHNLDDGFFFTLHCSLKAKSDLHVSNSQFSCPFLFRHNGFIETQCTVPAWHQMTVSS